MQKIKKHFTIKIKRGILDITKTKGVDYNAKTV